MKIHEGVSAAASCLSLLSDELRLLLDIEKLMKSFLK